MTERITKEPERVEKNGCPHDWKPGTINLNPEIIKHLSNGLEGDRLKLFILLALFVRNMNPFVFTVQEMSELMYGSSTVAIGSHLNWLAKNGYIRWRTERFCGQVWESVDLLDKGWELCA